MDQHCDFGGAEAKRVAAHSFLRVAVDFVGVFANVLIRRQLSLWLVCWWERSWRLFGRVLPAILALLLRGVIFPLNYRLSGMFILSGECRSAI